jgi:hypothetical protein
MAAPTKLFVAGLDAVRFYELVSGTGYMKATSTAAYDGYNAYGAITLDMSLPDPTYVAHPGNNSVLQQEVFPPTDPTTGTLSLSMMDTALIGLLSNVAPVTISNLTLQFFDTDKAGTEPTVGMIAYQRAKDRSGNRGWNTYVFPRITAIPKPSSMLTRDRNDVIYNINVQRATSELTAVTFTGNGSTATTAGFYSIFSNYRMHFCSFYSTAGSETEYTFDTNFPPYADGVVKVSVNSGAYLVEGAGAGKVVSTTTKITLGTGSTQFDRISCMYEVADSANMLDD